MFRLPRRTADGALTIMVVNKPRDSAAPVALPFADFPPKGSIQVWRLVSAYPIVRQTDLPASGNSVRLTVPAQSITLLIWPAK